MSDLSLRVWLRNRYRRAIERLAVEPETAVLKQTALVFAPHQDDETLGCGGTILKKTSAGAEVHIAFMTDGSTSHSRFMPPQQLAAIREQEAVAAAQALGVPAHRVHFFGFKDGRMDTVQDKASAIVGNLLQTVQPAQLFLPFVKEPPSDHFMTHAAVMAALRDYPVDMTIFEYPVWYWFHWPWVKLPQNTRSTSRTALKTSGLTWFGLRLMRDFQYGIYVGDVLAQKKVALDQHRSQMEQLQPDPAWLTLRDVADGDFLSCFFQDVELFHRYHYVKT